ncbi:hypothetical protein DFS34DRAFT_717897 [Phlyctochytrium arcticum]|nr:hypothetical protein DFS34DRAFT_717897 [Phlyctochytrium arcticum]
MHIPRLTPTSVLLLLSTALTTSQAFYLPGVAPKDYAAGESVELSVNILTSPTTLIPYDYYYEKFHHPRPEKEENERENLGSILFGDRLHNSAFKLSMMINATCQNLGAEVTVPAADAKFINQRIKEDYQQNWFVDGLPVASLMEDDNTKEMFYNVGFDLGYRESPVAPVFHINNHYDIHIKYHSDQTKNKHRVVGILIWPYSIKTWGADQTTCQPSGGHAGKVLIEIPGQETKVQYTYNVYWEPSTVSWGTRWDHYLYTQDPQVHWFSIINSIVIVLMLTGMIAVILLRALHKDIARYNAFGDEDGQEDFGWKLVHADVFRPPTHRMLLSVLVGNGAQLVCMAGITLIFAVLGFLSPSSRGRLTTVGLIFYVFFALVAGYVSARVYKMLQGEFWRRNVLMTATLVPGIVFLIFITLNFFLIGAHSSAAAPFSTMVALIALWFLVSLPTCMFGAYFGFRAPAIQHPVKTNQIPRQIPPQPLFLNKWISALIGGILPFGAIFIELYFIMNSIWFGRIYYVFGFLAVVFVILLVTCSEVAILMCYFHLGSEDYYWSWRAFLTAGASGFYVFLYSTFYYITRLTIVTVPSTILFFGWSLVMSILFSIMTGAVGYFAALIFVRKIFSSIKVD